MNNKVKIKKILLISILMMVINCHGLKLNEKLEVKKLNNLLGNKLCDGEISLSTCQNLGMQLIDSCIKIPAITPKQNSACIALKALYTGCLKSLNNGAKLDKYIGSDARYSILNVPHVFSPCEYEIGYMIMDEKCRKQITGVSL